MFIVKDKSDVLMIEEHTHGKTSELEALIRSTHLTTFCFSFRASSLSFLNERSHASGAMNEMSEPLLHRGYH